MSKVKAHRSRDRAKVSPLAAIARYLSRDPIWCTHAKALSDRSRSERSVHLAVCVEPFLSLILSGKKTVESRFSAVRFPPYGCVNRGDLVLLKRSGGPVVGVCEIGAAWFYKLDKDSWKTIRREFAQALCAQDPDFWRDRASAEYATLMYVSRATRVTPIDWPKRDRRGWVVVQPGAISPLFGGRMKTTVLAFSGGIASGKSTLSHAVAQSLGCPRVSFGGYMRLEAERRGLSTDRETLQTIGEELVAKDAEGLCRAVLGQTTWLPGSPLVVDGVRHVSIAEILQRLVAPSEFRLIYVSASEPARGKRFVQRGERGGDLRTLDTHSTEVDVHARLRDLADYRVNGDEPLETLIEEVSRWAHALP